MNSGNDYDPKARTLTAEDINANITGKQEMDFPDHQSANAKSPQATHLVSNVFEIDMLREKILTNVIERDQVALSDIAAMRLVQKDWLKDVQKLMIKARKPLFKLHLTEDNSLQESDYVRQHGVKLLDHFISTVTLPLSPTTESGIPPFSVCIDEEFFQEENHQSLFNFMAGGSTSGLVELEMNFPENGGSLNLIFGDHSPTFPILSKLTVMFCEEGDERSAEAHGSNSYFLPFLQTILKNASDLKEFILPLGHLSDKPTGIKYLSLPKTITKLHLECQLTLDQLEGLASNNTFPKLVDLSLPMYNTAVPSDLVFRILNKHKKTLQKFCLQGHIFHQKEDDDEPKITNFFSFPVMERLAQFNTNSIYAELDAAQVCNLQACLPKLKTLDLTNQWVHMLRKWTDNSVIPTVTELTVQLVEDNISEGYHQTVVPIRLEIMQAVHMAFPNVTQLSIHVTGQETCGLEYIFTKMRQLEELTINVWYSDSDKNSNHWDSLLTGVSMDIRKMLGANQEFLKLVNTLDLKVDKQCSIRNLNELRSLHLIAIIEENICKKTGHIIPLPFETKISDAVFHLAFLKMPNLKTLLLEGQFMVSPEMTQVWKNEQRSISYQPTSSRHIW